MAKQEKKLSKIDLIQKNEGFRTLVDLAEDLDEKGQHLNNWKMRGISKNAARKISEKYGYTIESLINDDLPLSKGLTGAKDDEATRLILDGLKGLKDEEKALIIDFIAVLHGGHSS